MPRISATTTFLAIGAPEVKGAEILLPVLSEDGNWYGLKAGKSVWRDLARAVADESAPSSAVRQGRPPVTSIGRIVGYVLPDFHKRAGDVVPAIITRVWDAEGKKIQLTPFVDLANDAPLDANACSSVEYSAEPRPRTWHWLPRV